MQSEKQQLKGVFSCPKNRQVEAVTLGFQLFLSEKGIYFVINLPLQNSITVEMVLGVRILQWRIGDTNNQYTSGREIQLRVSSEL